MCGSAGSSTVVVTSTERKVSARKAESKVTDTQAQSSVTNKGGSKNIYVKTTIPSVVVLRKEAYTFAKVVASDSFVQSLTSNTVVHKSITSN